MIIHKTETTLQWGHTIELYRYVSNHRGQMFSFLHDPIEVI